MTHPPPDLPRRPFHIRAAHLDDAPALIAGNRAMARETEDKELPLDVVTRGVQRVLRDDRCGLYLVAVDDDDDARVLGQLMLTREWSDWRDGWILWIQSVYVEPSQRRRGVYRALHAHVVSMWQPDSDVVGVRLYVEPHNARAIATYQQLGMHKTYDVMEQLP